MPDNPPTHDDAERCPTCRMHEDWRPYDQRKCSDPWHDPSHQRDQEAAESEAERVERFTIEVCEDHRAQNCALCGVFDVVQVAPLTALTQERERADKWRTLAANQSSDLRTAERQLHEARSQVEELKRIIGEHMQAVDHEGVLHHCGEPLCEANWWLYWAAGLVEKQPYEQKGPHTDRLSILTTQLKRCQEALRELREAYNGLAQMVRDEHPARYSLTEIVETWGWVMTEEQASAIKRVEAHSPTQPKDLSELRKPVSPRVRSGE